MKIDPSRPAVQGQSMSLKPTQIDRFPISDPQAYLVPQWCTNSGPRQVVKWLAKSNRKV